jgi:hypothetical protein
MANVSPIDLQKALKDASYPADGKSLADLAERNRAGKEVVRELKDHSKERFDGPQDVEKAVFHKK